MNRVWVMMAACAMLLSGCASNDEPAACEGEACDPVAETPQDVEQETPGETPETPDAPEESPDAPEDSPDTAEDAPNTPPVATFTTASTDVIAGESVAFDVNVTDADGDAFTWAVLVDGVQTSTNGTMNGTYNHVFDAEGTYEVTLNATDGQAFVEQTLTMAVAAPEPSGPEDRGDYMYDPATGLCHAKSYTDYGGLVYESAYGGGTWIFVETNDVAGLQFENNHPARDHPTPAGSFALDMPDCTGGDLTAV